MKENENTLPIRIKFNFSLLQPKKVTDEKYKRRANIHYFSNVRKGKFANVNG